MSEIPGKIKVQDAVLANMVSIAAILEYLDQQQPGAKTLIENRAHEIAQYLRSEMDKDQDGPGKSAN